MPRRTGTIAVVTSLFLTFFAFTASGAAGAGQKTPRAEGPTLSTKFRDRIIAGRGHEKAKSAAKKAPGRLKAVTEVPANRRALQFAGRAETGAAKAEIPSKGTPHVQRTAHRVALPTEKVQGDFVGRHGTGLGDVFENEPNDQTADILDDLPVNVVGFSDEDGDIDFFAITAVQGESIRIEVVADRIFDTSIDSFLEVLANDNENTLLASNDEFFEDSHDSFIRFVAPLAGEQTYFIGVSDFDGQGGGDNYGYILNITVADSPDFVENEPNDTTNLADEFPIPSVYFGGSDFTDDLDVYIFQGFAGEALIVDVDAEVFNSSMDAVAELYDDTGGFLFGVDDTDGIDPRFNILLPYTGTYYLAIYDRDGFGGDSYYYSVNLSTQSGALAPRISRFKIVNNSLLKRIIGSGFTRANGGTFAEINSQEVGGGPPPQAPTTRVKLSPAQTVVDGDVVTVVNPDGRRSNPGIIN